MENRKVYKCLISSAGDCKKERISCKKVIEDINNGLARHLKMSFETFMWEDDVLPDMGNNGQIIIDEFIEKSDYDIFIGIMRNRFGQPTLKAGSGTEHEFNDALKRKAESENSIPRIFFFFGKETVDPDNFDFEQYQKVKAFKAKVSNKGLYIDFTDTDDFQKILKAKLELFTKEHSPIEKPIEKIKEVDTILKKLEQDLNDSLKIYNEKSPIWIEPILSSKREVPNDPNKNYEFKVEIKDLINGDNDVVIKAPSEFGLTSLAHYLKLEAWKTGKTFLYLDTKKTKKHKITKDIINEADKYYHKQIKDIDVVLLDSVIFEENGVMQMIKNVCEEFKNLKLIVFNTLDSTFFLKSDEDDKVEIKRDFLSYYLLPLPQNEVRKLVASYSTIKHLVDDKDVILNKVTKDLEALNMHRTAKNCISILRASSKIGSEYSPVNRTKLLETLLHTIFEEYEIPTYRDKKPDVKDCSFVLGFFCELLVLRNNFEFDKNFFINSIKEFCEASFIDLDIAYLLNVLTDNYILGNKGQDTLYFKSSYWVFYFIAQRMNMSKVFLEKVYESKKYVDFTEIIEFYTGIDRNKEDAVKVLTEDLKETLQLVRTKVNIPDDINPYKSISWNPDISALEREETKIGENVISSGLPDEVKDKYDDKSYNQIRPYNQVVNSVIRDYSFLVLMKQISATSRALRNSDFVSADYKKELLDMVTQSWNEINKLLIVLSPLLAEKGTVTFEGANFYLEDGYSEIKNTDEKKLAILLAVPINVLKLFKDDLTSSKMGTLLIEKAKTETNSLIKHELMLLLVFERPKNWHKAVDNYIVSLDKNSFYLSDIFGALDFNKDYKVVETEDKRIIDLLASKCRAKHIFNQKNPDIGLINRMKKIDQKNKV